MKVKSYVLVLLTPFGALTSEHENVDILFQHVNTTQQFVVSITIYPLYEINQNKS